STLPLGLQYIPSKQKIVGIPRTPAGISVQLTASNDSGTDTETLTIIINSPTNKSSAAVKYSDSATDKPFGSKADGFEALTSTKASISASVTLTPAEMASIGDAAELYFEVGDFVFDHVLGTATTRQSGKKYVF